jgi:ClpP class serine protease
MKNYLHLLQRVNGVPLAIQEDKLRVITDNVLLPMAFGGAITKEYPPMPAIEAARGQTIRMFSDSQVARNQSPVATPSANDFAVITVMDTLTARHDPWASGGTSYASLAADVDAKVTEGYKNIMFYLDSPGGEVSGLFELTAKLAAIRDSGIFLASYVEGGANSAAYAIASVTQHISATRSSTLGSIGTILVHLETSKADEQAGRTYTIIRSKPDKATPDSRTPLNEAGQNKLQALVDTFDTMFNTEVEKNRSSLPVESIIALRGDSFLAEKALQLNLADAIVVNMNEAAVAALAFKKTLTVPKASAKTKLSTSSNLGVTMNEEQLLAALEQAKLATATAEAKVAQAATDERTRCLGIINACSTLRLSVASAKAHIEKGYTTEMSLEIMTAVAEAKGQATANIAAAQTTEIDPDLDTKLRVDEQNAQSRMDTLRAAAKAAGLTLRQGVK